MSGLSQIQPGAAAQSANVLPVATQASAQNQVLGGINQLSAFQHPFQANQLTQTQAFNPFAPQATAGAQAAAGFGGQAATNQFNLGGNLETLGTNVSASGQPLIQGGNQVLGTAFDPQSALYQRNLQLMQQQFEATNALSGVGSTPYAAGLNAQNIQNFNISWQAQQLANQVAGLNAASGAFGTAGGLAQTGAGISGVGAGLQAGAPQLAMQSAMYPYLFSEQAASTGMSALGALQQYGMNAPQQQIQDLLSLLGQVPGFQQANTNAAAVQAQIQAQNMQQLMKGIGGAAAFAGIPATGGLSTLSMLNTPLTNPNMTWT